MARHRHRTLPVIKRRTIRLIAGILAGAGAAGGWAAHHSTTGENVAYTATPDAVEVVDGDTIRLMVGGEKVRVRLLGVDAPEKGDCGAKEATARLQQLVTDSDHITIRTDPVAGSTDRYNRILGYVELDGKDVADTLISEGLVGVWWPQSAPTPTRGKTYRDIQKKAVDAKTGSWAACGVVGRH